MESTDTVSNVVVDGADTAKLPETPEPNKDVSKEESNPSDAAEHILPKSPTVFRTGFFIFFKDARLTLKLDELGSEIAHIAVPAALALAADPLASLADTAFIGQIGPVDLAAVGVAIAVFNQFSRIAIYPLVSVTTSFVAEESVSSQVCRAEQENLERAFSGSDEMEVTTLDGPCQTKWIHSCLCFRRPKDDDVGNEKKHIPSVSSAMVVGGILGIIQAILLIFAGKFILNIMGIKPDSPMMSPAHRYLTLRALGSPAVLLSLAMQGVFRGFKDTRTPLYATVVGDVTNIILDPIFIFQFHLGVTGAGIAHVLSQYLMSLILLGRLMMVVNIMPPSIRDLKFSRFLKCGFLLLARVVAVTICVTLAASMAARHGPITMAAFQICLQLWMATSLLADGLAVAGQAILASAFTRGDSQQVVAASARVLQLSVVLGVGLSMFIGVFMQYGSGVFTKDANVMKLIHICIPFVAATQPINSLAFVFDGINFGASDYTYSAYSMVVVAVISITCLFLLSASHGLVGIWIALMIYISLRALAGIWRMGAARGPWAFLRH